MPRKKKVEEVKVEEVNNELTLKDFDYPDLVDTLKNIELKPVQSSNIAAIGYNEAKKVLRVIFKGNGSYLYLGVEPEVYESIIKAESKGSQLNESIIKQKDKYKYFKM